VLEEEREEKRLPIEEEVHVPGKGKKEGFGNGIQRRTQLFGP